jgi:DNA-binding Xre family transcriptional regulator
VSGRVGYRWHLRRLMADRGMFATSALVPLLAERGVHLSREQVYRLVARTPERLSLSTLAALCDILGCAPGDLVEPYRQPGRRRTAEAAPAPAEPAAPPKPRRARVTGLPGA